jgi:hypothetical protein
MSKYVVSMITRQPPFVCLLQILDAAPIGSKPLLTIEGDPFSTGSKYIVPTSYTVWAELVSQTPLHSVAGSCVG